MMFASKVARTVLVLATGTLPGLSLGQGDGTFESPLRIPGPRGVGIDAGDFNRDGKLDLAVVDGASGVTVLNQSAGNRLDWSTTTNNGGGFFVRAADLDGDGELNV